MMYHIQLPDAFCYLHLLHFRSADQFGNLTTKEWIEKIVIVGLQKEPTKAILKVKGKLFCTVIWIKFCMYDTISVYISNIRLSRHLIHLFRVSNILSMITLDFIYCKL